MADISKVVLPDGNTYDLKVYTDHVKAFSHKTYESTSYYATAANQLQSTWYFMSVRPETYNKVWRVFFKLHTFCPSYPNCNSITFSVISGRQNAFTYMNYNEFDSTGHYYISCYPLLSAGFNAGYGHAIGMSIFYASSYTNSAYYRTFEVDLIDTENCTVTLLDTPVKWDSWPGTGSTYYGSLSNLNGASRGLQETGDSNDPNYYHRIYYSNEWKTATALYRYQVLFQQSEDVLLPANAVNNSVATNKTLTTESFDPFGKIFYYNTTSTYSAGAAIGASATLYDNMLCDTRYAFNTAGTLVAYKRVYLVVVPQSDGMVKLAPNPIAQDLPSSEDSYWYILLGWAYNTNNIELIPEHPVCYYKDGNIIEITSKRAKYAENADLVNGHTVDSDVPSGAKFTDTTYSAGTGISLTGTTFSNSGATGVKGNAENSYRTGNVNLTYPNLGTAPIANGGTGQTSAVEANWALENRGYASDANSALSVGIYNTNTSTLNLPTLAYSQNNGCGILICYVSSASTHNNSNNWIWQIWLNTTTSDLYKRKKINSSGWGTWQADTDTAAKLTTARTLNVGGQATGNAQSFDGTADVVIPITAFNTLGLQRPSGIRGVGDNTLQALFNATRANRLAFLPADQIIIETTTDGGTTWVDAGVSDDQKRALFAETRPSITIPKIDGVRSPLCGLRVTFSAMKYNVPSDVQETEKYNYWNSAYVKSGERYNQLKDFYFWVNGIDGSIGIKIEGATGANSTSWATLFDDPTYYMTGWSGCDYVHLSTQRVFGGSAAQVNNTYWNYRMTFMSKGKNGTDDFNTGSKTASQSIMEIRGYGDVYWTKGNEYAATDKIYVHDSNKNVTFPAGVTATQFSGDLTGSASMVNGHTVAVDVPANAVFTDTTYDVATVNSNGLMSSQDKSSLNNLGVRVSDIENTLANIDLSDPSAALYNLALRVAALESHAILDSGYTIPPQ